MNLGWLSPTGEFIQCALMDHLSVAREIADELNYPKYDDIKDKLLHPDEQLLRNGWVHITRFQLGAHEYVVYWQRHLTQEQKRYLEPFFNDDNSLIDRLSRFEWEEEINND